MSLLRRFSVAFVAVLTALPAVAQIAPSDPLPFDPDVRIGTLDNGLQYYIRRNTEPEGRAELRLALNAGSILEEDDQQGLAHFVEHMAFNGTERFDEPELVRYLESVGTRFGPDLNAYTSFDETVYILQVPTDSVEVFDTGIDVLHEWAGAVALADSAIERERGVVLEEWRIGRGAQQRMNRTVYPVLFGGSRYAERLPIGTPEVIETAPADRLRAFYRDWYRPDLMAVIVVGDVDVDAVEARIQDQFSDLAGPSAPPERTVYTVPTGGPTEVAIATDAEAPFTLVRLMRRGDPRRETTYADARRALVEGLFYGAVQERLAEIQRTPDAPYAFAGAANGNLVRTVGATQLIGVAKPGEVEATVRVLATEGERARRYGITPGEFERQKADLLRQAQSAVAEAENQESRALAGAYVNAFLTEVPVVAPADQLALTEAFLPTITLDEVNAVGQGMAMDESLILTVTGPEDAAMPTEDVLLAAIAEALAAEIAPYDDETVEGPLVPEMPAPGSIVATDADADLGTMTWTLSNGATVILKPTDFKADEVLLSATSPGGTSLLSNADLPVAGGAGGFVSQSGVGGFDQTALGKALSGQIVSVRPTVSGRTEGFQGSAAPGDLETLFQLVHLYVTAPRLDADAFQASLAQTRGFLGNQVNVPRVAFQDTLSATIANGDPRSQTLSEYLASLDQADPDAALAFYRDRFADVSDFTFVLVGAFEPEAIRPLVETYLASLPGSGREEEAVEHPYTAPTGVVEKVVRAGVEPQAQVALVFHGEIDADDNEDRVFFRAMADVLSKMLREELREDRGGVYGVGVRPSIDRDRDRYSLQVSFGADPERVEELVDAVFAQIAALKAGEAPAEHLAAFKEQQRRARETNLQENRYWLGVLTSAATRDEDPDEALSEADLAAEVTMPMVVDMAEQTIDMDQYIRVVLLPIEDAE